MTMNKITIKYTQEETEKEFKCFIAQTSPNHKRQNKGWSEDKLSVELTEDKGKNDTCPFSWQLFWIECETCQPTGRK